MDLRYLEELYAALPREYTSTTTAQEGIATEIVSRLRAVMFYLMSLVNQENLVNSLRSFKYNLLYNGLGTWFYVVDLWNKWNDKLVNMQDRKGCVAIVTGASRGIGLAVARSLAESGLTVIAAVRDPDRCSQTIEELKKETGNNEIHALQLDLSSMKSVRMFVDNVNSKYGKVNIVVNNAAVLFGDYTETEDGFEKQIATNYLGHFYLCWLLMRSLVSSGRDGPFMSRIVNVSSSAEAVVDINAGNINLKGCYHHMAGYCTSKKAQLMFSRYLNRLLESENLPVRCYAAHPGFVYTKMTADFISKSAINIWLADNTFKTPRQGATSIVHCCLSSDLEGLGGQFVTNCKEAWSTCSSRDVEKQKKLFHATCNMLGIEDFFIGCF